MAVLVLSGCDQPLGMQSQNQQYSAFMSPDILADRMINDDPELLIVDLRDEDAYAKFTIPGAVNVPLETWTERHDEIANMMDGHKGVVLADDLGTGARFASAYLQEKGICEPFILEGGIENFVETIFIPLEVDAALIDQAELDENQFREAAAMYFVGLSQPIEPQPYIQPRPVQKKKVKVAPKKKIQEDEEEGC